MEHASPHEHARGDKRRWHSLRRRQALELVDGHPEGLSAEEVHKRLDQYGGNRLPRKDKESTFRRLATYATPFHTLFGTQSIGWAPWGRALMFGIAVFFVVELEKSLLRRRYGRTLQ